MMNALETLQFQKVLSKHLNEQCAKPPIDTHDTVTLCDQPDTDCLIEDSKSEELKSQQNLAKAQTSLHQKNVKLYYAKNLQKQTSRKVNSMVETLFDLKYAIACALELSVIRDFELGGTQNFSKMSKNDFLAHLFSVLKIVK